MKVKLDFEISRYGKVLSVKPFTKRAKELTKYFADNYSNTAKQEYGTLIVGKEDWERVMFELCDHEMTARLTF
ncbi:MAG: hypothetical protein OXG15_10160 [Gammaproteobacteria bacterium]|nr:hypothetical protein [Gammaproteobacteria bacterium]